MGFPGGTLSKKRIHSHFGEWRRKKIVDTLGYQEYFCSPNKVIVAKE